MKRGPHAPLPADATREVAGLIGALLFGGASAMELIRLIALKSPRPGFSSVLDWAYGGVSIVLWVGSAVVLATRTRAYRTVPILGVLWLFSYGIIERLARSHFGLVYLFFSVALVFLERLAFGGKLTLGSRSEEPNPPDAGREVL